MPADAYDLDFKTFTCGISKFQRRKGAPLNDQKNAHSEIDGPVPQNEWRHGRGVAGGWDCVRNSDCTHLDGGEERGWLVFIISASLVIDPLVL